MKTAVFAYSRQGSETARRVLACVAEGQAYTLEKYLQPGFLPLSEDIYASAFREAEALIFVGACGIAVRKIAPFVKSKTTDPAVLCIDERAGFVIPLLSGHIGGANALAKELAVCLQAVPVITTATDVNGRFSVDAWAARHGLALSSMKAAKAVSAAILERDVPLHSDFPVKGDYPAGTCASHEGAVGICIGYDGSEPFATTLRLIPKVLHLGIGCRRGIAKEAIAAAVSETLRGNRIDPRAIRCAASVDLKKDEAGLLAFCEEQGLPIRFYSAEELNRLEGDFSRSDFVRRVAGVDCVCERSAMMDADRLIVKKTALNGVTVAVATERYEVCFGETQCCGHRPR